MPAVVAVGVDHEVDTIRPLLNCGPTVTESTVPAGENAVIPEARPYVVRAKVLHVDSHGQHVGELVHGALPGAASVRGMVEATVGSDVNRLRTPPLDDVVIGMQRDAADARGRRSVE